MNPEMMLSQLAPLREPMAISWWPLAPGWWIVHERGFTDRVVLWLRKRRLKTAYRRIALVALDELRSREAGQDELNWLLKAAALRAYPQEQVAGLHGTAWQQFLASAAPRSRRTPLLNSTASISASPRQSVASCLMRLNTGSVSTR